MDLTIKNIKHANKNYLHLAIVFIPVLLVFLWSMPKTVVLEDDGTFILAAFFNGLAHPPGYPLYTFLAHWATQIPAGTVASRVHAFSALMGAASCVVLWLIVFKLLTRRILATTAGLIFGFSLTFWSQAIIAEVYTLNVLLFLVLFLLCLHYRDKPDSVFLFPVMCFIYGLSLSNHWPLIILSSPLLVAVIWPVKFEAIKRIGTGSICLLFGLLPYLWMFINSNLNPVISFYGPLENLTDFLFMISREGYKTIDTTSTAGWLDKLQFSGFIFSELYRQFRPFGILFLFIGFLQQWKILPRSVAIGLLLGFLGPTFILIILLGTDFDIVHMNTFRVYPIIAYAISAIWIITGIKIVNDWGIEKYSNYINPKFFSISIPLLLVSSVLFSNIPANYRDRDTMARDYAGVILQSLEQNAVFFTYADIDTGPIGYMNMIEGLRPDVTVYNGQGLVFSNRLFYPLRITKSEKKSSIHNFLDNTDRPVYFSTTLLTDYGFEDYGLYAKVNPEIVRPQRKIIVLQDIIDFLEKVFDQGKPHDHWDKMFYHLLEMEYCRVTASQMLFREEYKPGEFNLDELKILCKGFSGRTELAELILYMSQPDWDFVKKILHEAESIKEEIISKEDSIRVYNLWGKYYQLRGEDNQAREILQRSIDTWPDQKNRAYQLLTELQQP